MSGLKLTLSGIAVGVAIGYLVGSSQMPDLYQSRLNFVKDLDGNKIEDQILKLDGGYQIPMFGYRLEDGSLDYVSATKMEELFPESTVDYSGIERMLNQVDEKD